MMRLLQIKVKEIEVSVAVYTTVVIFMFPSVGIPILKIVYGADPQLSVMSIPLLIYHPTQILLGGLLVPSVRGWMSTTKTFRYAPYERHNT